MPATEALPTLAPAPCQALTLAPNQAQRRNDGIAYDVPVFNVSGAGLVVLLVELVILLAVVYLVVRVARLAWKGREPRRRL